MDHERSLREPVTAKRWRSRTLTTGAAALLVPLTVIGVLASGAGSAPAPAGGAACARNEGERLIRLIAPGQTCGSHETKVQLSGSSGNGGGVAAAERVSRASRASGNTYQSATASCPVGKTALGGGYELVNYAGGQLPAALQYSRPTPSLDGWEVAAELDGRFFGNWSITAYAVCARQSS
jgi:hypothetical protein